MATASPVPRSRPLPRLAEDEAACSRLHCRVAFVIDRTGTGAGEHLAAALDAQRGVDRVVATGVFDEGIPTTVGNHLMSRDAGLGTLVPAGVLLAALRSLTDDLIGGAGGGPGGLVVERSSDRSTDACLVRAVYPDGFVVVVEDHPEEDPDRATADLTLRPEEIRRAPTGAAAQVVHEAQRARRGSRRDPTRRAPAVDPDGGLGDRLILVFGVPRSGTTWLEQLLLAPASTTGVEAAETWMFKGIQGFWRNHEGGRGLHTVVERAALAAALRRFCDALLLDWMRRTPGASHFVEKTPGNAWLLPWINAVYPDAWYVHILRDGRDVSRSIAEMSHGTSDVRRAAADWVATLLEVEARSPALARFREVRYEELLDAPVEQAADLLAWAGVHVGGSDLDAIRATAGVRVSRHGTSGPVGAGKWATMAAEERRIVLATAGDLLVRKGYATPEEVGRARREVRRPSGVLGELRRRVQLTSRPGAPG